MNRVSLDCSMLPSSIRLNAGEVPGYITIDGHEFLQKLEQIKNDFALNEIKIIPAKLFKLSDRKGTIINLDNVCYCFGKKGDPHGYGTAQDPTIEINIKGEEYSFTYYNNESLQGDLNKLTKLSISEST